MLLHSIQCKGCKMHIGNWLKKKDKASRCGRHCWHKTNVVKMRHGACQEKFSMEVMRCCTCLKEERIDYGW